MINNCLLEFVTHRFGDEGLEQILGDAALPNGVSFKSGCVFADKMTYRILEAAAARSVPSGVAVDEPDDKNNALQLHGVLFQFGVFFVSWAQIAGYEKVSGWVPAGTWHVRSPIPAQYRSDTRIIFCQDATPVNTGTTELLV